jgi:DNA-binding MarR family transcriptional regulator
VPPRTPAGDAVSGLVVRVFRLNGGFLAAGDRLSSPAGQTSARWCVLAAIEDAPLTVAQIARELVQARQSVQRVADLLAADGLADYADNPAHARAKLLRLTPGGLRALRMIQAAQCAWADALGAEIGAAELLRASEVLDRVLAALARPHEDDP